MCGPRCGPARDRDVPETDAHKPAFPCENVKPLNAFMNVLLLASFGLCAALTLVGALTVVSSADPRRGVIGLLSTVTGAAGCFAMLDAHFVSGAQLIVYGGAVSLLYVAAMKRIGDEVRSKRPEGQGHYRHAIGAVAVGMTCAGIFAVFSAPTKASPRNAGGASLPKTLPTPPEGFGSLDRVGDHVFTQTALPFELLAVLLLVALLAVMSLMRRTPKPTPRKSPALAPEETPQ